MSYRLGVDVGGTFTDLLLIDETTSKTFRVKTPSTPSDQSEGVLAGIAKICQSAGITPDKLTSLMHGTTVATNAILEGKGARVGLIVTDGYRQVLHIGRSFVPGGLAGWIIWQKPETLATLENTVEVKERIGARGDVVRKLDEASVRRALKSLAGKGVEAITVSLINAFANDAHEKRIRSMIAPEMSAAVMMQNVPWNAMNSMCGMVPFASRPTPARKTFDRSPLHEFVPENASV